MTELSACERGRKRLLQKLPHLKQWLSEAKSESIREIFAAYDLAHCTLAACESDPRRSRMETELKKTVRGLERDVVFALTRENADHE